MSDFYENKTRLIFKLIGINTYGLILKCLIYLYHKLKNLNDGSFIKVAYEMCVSKLLEEASIYRETLPTFILQEC